MHRIASHRILKVISEYAVFENSTISTLGIWKYFIILIKRERKKKHRLLNTLWPSQSWFGLNKPPPINALSCLIECWPVLTLWLTKVNEIHRLRCGLRPTFKWMDKMNKRYFEADMKSYKWMNNFMDISSSADQENHYDVSVCVGCKYILTYLWHVSI